MRSMLLSSSGDHFSFRSSSVSLLILHTLLETADTIDLQLISGWSSQLPLSVSGPELAWSVFKIGLCNSFL